MTSIRGIMFDFDATLGKGKLNRELLLRYIYENVNRFEDVDFLDFEVIFRSTLSKLNQKRMNTQVEPTTEEYYGEILQAVGIMPSQDILRQIHTCIEGCYSFQPYPSVRDTLYRLRQEEYLLAVVSNTINGTTKLGLAKQGLLGIFDVVVQSCDVGVRKPDPGIFEIALQRMKLSCHNVVAVGNSPYFDIYGAQQAGLLAVWVQTELSYREPTVTWNITPDHTIASVSELPELLAKLKCEAGC